MPGVPGVTERPRSVHSGRPLRKAHTVQHRSDLLMDEQVQTVKDAQEALHKSLLEFESNKAPEHVEFHKKRVEDMKERADEAVLILKVINKLNTELAYARLIMEKTLKFGGDPNPIRKRIAWIEGKMEQLCWRKRNRPHSRTQQSPRKGIATILTNHAEDGAENQDDTSVRRLDAGYITDYSSAHTIEPPSMSEAEDHPHLPRYRKDRVESKESERETVLTSKRKTKKKTIKDGEQIRDENNESQITQDDSIKHAKLPARPQTMPEKTDLTLYPASTAYTLDTTRQSTMLLSEPVTRESGHRGLKSEDEHKVKREQSLPEAPPPLEEPAKPDSAGSSMSRATLETNNLSLPPTRETNNNNNESVFITERNNLVSRGMSRVTILSPRDTEGLQPSEYTDEERDVDVDIVEEYWNSEHHRFEYSEYADMLLQMDPLSYHQMGLAVPGTYVDAIEPKKSDLPWQAKSASELLDIHEVAMNKLSQRVHKMYDKIQDAAMMSVDPNYKKDAPIESTFLKNLDQFSSRGQTADSSHRGHSGKAPGSGSDRQTPKDDAASVTFPPLRMSAMRDKLGSTQSGRLIYYPHPLTPPAPLPITRVNKEKEYPQLPSTFNDVESPREKAERIVNQQKLYEKTKLRIYKGKVKSKTPHSQQPGYMQGVLKTSTSDFPANETSPTPSKRTTFKAMARSVSRMSAGSENMPSPRSSRRASGYSVMSNASRASVDFTDEHDQFGWKKLKPRSQAS